MLQPSLIVKKLERLYFLEIAEVYSLFLCLISEGLDYTFFDSRKVFHRRNITPQTSYRNYRKTALFFCDKLNCFLKYLDFIYFSKTSHELENFSLNPIMMANVAAFGGDKD